MVHRCSIVRASLGHGVHLVATAKRCGSWLGVSGVAGADGAAVCMHMHMYMCMLHVHVHVAVLVRACRTLGGG